MAPNCFTPVCMDSALCSSCITDINLILIYQGPITQQPLTVSSPWMKETLVFISGWIQCCMLVLPHTCCWLLLSPDCQHEVLVGKQWIRTWKMIHKLEILFCRLIWAFCLIKKQWIKSHEYEHFKNVFGIHYSLPSTDLGSDIFFFIVTYKF